jgi:hypothetical protein
LVELVDLQGGQSDKKLDEIKEKIKKLQADLKSNYDIDQEMSNAQVRIQELLLKFGKRFDFEKSYTPIQLHFSLETFNLWHEPEAGKQVFLRSMGSCANWLSWHLVLYLALQRYFPSILDGGTEFSPNELAKKDSSRDKSRPIAEDVKAVTNLFEQLVRYCQETKDEPGIMPQIIVTGHADHLKLPGNVTFESLIRKRWRQDDEGFIESNSREEA